jgi:hypothetical protein
MATSTKPKRSTELIRFLSAVRKLQEALNQAQGSIIQEPDDQAVADEDFLPKTSLSLLQRYSSSEYMLRIVLAQLEDGLHPPFDEPLGPDSSWGTYLQEKLKHALSPYGFVLARKRSSRANKPTVSSRQEEDRRN